MATIPSSYKAVIYERFGKTEDIIQLKEVATEPLPAGHVRVRVHSAGLNPIDWKVPEIFKAPFLSRPEPTPEAPYRFGWDVAGVVAEVAADVEGFKVGDEVYAMVGERKFGSVAEYLAVGAQYLAYKPKTLSLDQAGAVPLSALTSFQAVTTHGKVQAGEKVLILGGSSSTGIFAIQFAKSIGAYVISTTSAKNADFVRSLGADEVVDYTTQQWREVVAKHSVDVLLDCGMEPLSWEDGAQEVLKQTTGRFVTLEPGHAYTKAKYGASTTAVIGLPSGGDLAQIAELYDSGKVKLVVDSTFPIEKTAEAIARIKTNRAVGKVIVKVL